jgi:hypothetical protein
VPLSIKTKQVAGVTLIVALSVALLTGWYLSSLAYVRLEEANRRVRLLVDAIYQGAQAVVASRADYIEGLKTDSGLRSILEASAYDDYIVYAAIVDRDGQIVAGTLGPTEQPLPPAGDLEALLNAGTVQQVRTVYAQGGQMLEQRRPLFLQTADGSTEIGAIRVGLSTLLLKGRSPTLFKTYLYTAGSVIIGTILIATVFAQLLLRPIHVIRSGLARLGRGELDVNVDLPKDEEFGDLGESFKAVSARLAQDRTELAGQRPRWNPWWSISKMPSRCLPRMAGCSSPTRRCAPRSVPGRARSRRCSRRNIRIALRSKTHWPDAGPKIRRSLTCRTAASDSSSRARSTTRPNARWA